MNTINSYTLASRKRHLRLAICSTIWCPQGTHILFLLAFPTRKLANLLFISDPTLSSEKTFLPVGSSNQVVNILVLLCLGHCEMLLFNLQSRIVCGLGRIVFKIITNMYTGMTYLNSVLLLTVRNFLGGFGLKLLCISRIEGTRLSLVRLFRPA